MNPHGLMHGVRNRIVLIEVFASGHQMPSCSKPVTYRLKNTHSENTENPAKHKPQERGH